MNAVQRAAVTEMIKKSTFSGFPNERCHQCFGTNKVAGIKGDCPECLEELKEFVDELAGVLGQS